VYQHASGDTSEGGGSEGGGGIELAGSSLIVRMMPRIERDLLTAQTTGLDGVY